MVTIAWFRAGLDELGKVYRGARGTWKAMTLESLDGCQPFGGYGIQSNRSGHERFGLVGKVQPARSGSDQA
jgi:hypothetical protein